MDILEKLNFLYDKFKDNFDFDGSFHTVLWHIMIEENRKGMKSAFVSAYNSSGLILGIADKDMSGYSPSLAYFKPGTKYDDAQVIIDELNKKVFGLSHIQAMEIIATTMRK